MARPLANGAAASTVHVRRLMLVERFLVDVVGLPWSQVHEEADRIGPVVTPRVEALLADALGEPGTCPHGEPIPGSPNAPDQSGAVPLATAVGLVSVTRTARHLETDARALEMLEASALLPGRVAEVLGASSAGVCVASTETTLVVPSDVAAGVFVTPLASPS